MGHVVVTVVVVVAVIAVVVSVTVVVAVVIVVVFGGVNVENGIKNVSPSPPPAPLEKNSIKNDWQISYFLILYFFYFILALRWSS